MMNFETIIVSCRSLLFDSLEKGISEATKNRVEEILLQINTLSVTNKAIDRLKKCLEDILELSSSQNLLELNSIVQKISVTLLAFESKPGEGKVINQNSSYQFSVLRHSEVKHLIRALKTKSSARTNLLRLAAADQRFLSLNLLPHYVSSIDDRSSEVLEILFTEIFPGFGKSALPLLRRKFHFGSTIGQLGVLAFLLTFESDVGSRKLCCEIAEKGNSELKKYMLNKVSSAGIEKEVVESLMNSRSREVRDLASGIFEKYS